MKYVKAKSVFPHALLLEMQKYVQGEMVYIPKAPGNRDSWGANTDTRSAVARRNEEIVRAYRAGVTVSELTELFYLSGETIRKIIYRRSK